MDENCIFCKIIKGEIPSSKVYEDDEVLQHVRARRTAENTPRGEDGKRDACLEENAPRTPPQPPARQRAGYP